MFSRLRMDWWKVRERDIATFDANQRVAGMLNPMRDKNEGTYRGRGGTTPVTTAFPEENR